MCWLICCVRKDRHLNTDLRFALASKLVPVAGPTFTCGPYCKLPQLRSELTNEKTFGDIYSYAYGFPCEKGQKCLQLDTAVAVWQLMFSEQGWPWCQVLEANHKLAVSKDTWSQVLEFAKIVRTEADLQQFDASSNSAWPYLIDDFVHQLRGPDT